MTERELAHGDGAHLESFLELEKELGLLDRKIGGVELWERLRFSVYQRILQGAGLVDEGHVFARRGLGAYLKGAWMLARNLVYRNPLLSDPSEILFLGAPRRRLMEDGRWWDVHCDPIITSMPWSYTYLEPPYANRHRAHVPTRQRRFLDAIRYRAYIRRRLRIPVVRLSQAERALLAELERRIATEFEVSVGVQDLAVQSLAARKVSLPAYERIVSRVRPKLVYLVCSYGNETLIESCKNAGVQTAELQHGVISEDHLGYSYPEYHSRKSAFPDHLLIFGDYWKEGARLPIPQERVHSVGYPFLEAQVEKYGGCEKKHQVIFVSEATIGAELSRIACAVSRGYEGELPMVYKLHPAETEGWRKRYPWLAESDIHVVDTDDPPLHKLLAQSCSQVGVCSTAVYEGLAFGLPTILVDLPGIGHMRQLLESGGAILVSSAEELLDSVLEAAAGESKADWFFRSDSLRNTLELTEELLERSRGPNDG